MRPLEITERAHAETVTTIHAGGFTSPADLYREVAHQCDRYFVTVAESQQPGFLTKILKLEQSREIRRDVLDFEMRFSRPVPDEEDR